MLGWVMLTGGGVLMLTPMYLNPLTGVNGMTLLGIVLAVAGTAKLLTDREQNETP